jgi:hypothetical protein
LTATQASYSGGNHEVYHDNIYHDNTDGSVPGIRWHRDRSGRTSFGSGPADEGDLLADGSVQITMKVRCNDQQQAFEWSVDIRQGTIFGNDSGGPVAGVITCNGKFHTVDALVPGANGPYTAGPANVQALVQLFDAVEGSDVELEDRAVVRLRP